MEVGGTVQSPGLSTPKDVGERGEGIDSSSQWGGGEGVLIHLHTGRVRGEKGPGALGVWKEGEAQMPGAGVRGGMGQRILDSVRTLCFWSLRG